MKNCILYYESPQDVPAPYHFESKIEIDFEGNQKASIDVNVQYIDREDFSKEDLMAEGLQVENQWAWKGELPTIWVSILQERLNNYIAGEASPKSHEPFICFETEKGQTFKPKQKLEKEDVFLQEFMQAILELAEKEFPLYLGFQFNHLDKGWILIEGEMSFASRKFNFIENGKEEQVKEVNFDAIQALMNDLFIGEFIADKAQESLKNKETFAVFPGDGLWYTAGNSWKKPNGNYQYFVNLEDTLNELFS